MKRILILEDDQQFRELLELILTDAGYRVRAVGNGGEGLAAMAAERFDLVISDMFMPEINGVQFLRAIKKNHPDIQVIGMSGGGRGVFPQEVLPVFKAMGVGKTLLKPFTGRELLPMVRELIGG